MICDVESSHPQRHPYATICPWLVDPAGGFFLFERTAFQLVPSNSAATTIRGRATPTTKMATCLQSIAILQGSVGRPLGDISGVAIDKLFLEACRGAGGR